MTLSAPHPEAARGIAPLVAGGVHVSEDGRRLSAVVDATRRAGHFGCARARRAGVLVDNIEVRQPSLDDVFLSLTGGHIEEEDSDGPVSAPSTERPDRPLAWRGHSA